MDCPMTTGFDTALKVCNYAASLPRYHRLPHLSLLSIITTLVMTTMPRCKATGSSLLVDTGQISIVARRARQSLLDVEVMRTIDDQ